MNGKSIMWEYISQEPSVLRQLLQSEEIGKVASVVGNEVEEVYFVAHGSSYNAAITISDFISRVSGIRGVAYTPANFQYNTDVLQKKGNRKSLIVVISQTGTSSGAIEVLKNGKKQGYKVLGITDASESPVAKESDYTLLLGCGEEDSNAKTKGYSATLTLLLLFSLQLGLVKGRITETTKKKVLKELELQINDLPAIVENTCTWCEKHEFGNALTELYVLGYGMNFGTAMEGQLKLMETMCIPTMFNDIGEFSHGMHRAITEKSSIFIIQTEYPLKELAEETFAYLQKVSKHVLMLDASDSSVERDGRIRIPYYPYTQSVLLTTVALQVLSVFAPEQVGKDPNRDAHNDFTEVVHTRV